MLDYQGAISEYKKLNYSEKKVKLITLFEIFKEHSQSIENMLPLIQSDKMWEQDMLQIYADLSTAIWNLDRQGLEKAFSNIDKLRLKIHEIREKEEEDKKTENVDALLNNI